MEKVHRLSQSLNILTVIAIATSGISFPASAGTNITTSQESLQLAQASLVGQCRATKLQIPIFRAADATSEAIGLIASDEQVTLADNAVGANGFIGISAPLTGFVHAVNLKTCSSGTAPPGDKDVCRQVVRPPQGLLIRRQPSTTAAQVGQVASLGRVTLSTTPATVKQADNRNWIEISSPARGWVSNGLLTERQSNLVYCK